MSRSSLSAASSDRGVVLLERRVANYYRDRLASHGATHLGVDWPTAESQELRFEILTASIDFSTVPSLLDFGCGYGALADFLDRRQRACRYVGYDIAPEMVQAASRAHAARADRSFTADATELTAMDHVLASGIFNVKLDTPDAGWERYVRATIGRLWQLTVRTLAFNLIPPASRRALARSHLHYAEPRQVVRWCRELGGDVTLRENYGLWEYTVIVKRGQQ